MLPVSHVFYLCFTCVILQKYEFRRKKWNRNLRRWKEFSPIWRRFNLCFAPCLPLFRLCFACVTCVLPVFPVLSSKSVNFGRRNGTGILEDGRNLAPFGEGPTCVLCLVYLCFACVLPVFYLCFTCVACVFLYILSIFL